MEINKQKFLGMEKLETPLTELEKRILNTMTDEEIKAYMANR